MQIQLIIGLVCFEGSRLVGGGGAGGHGDSTPRSQSNMCPICGTLPRVPFVASPCRHVFCYYCLRYVFVIPK
jgi:hypothetical protein